LRFTHVSREDDSAVWQLLARGGRDIVHCFGQDELLPNWSQFIY